MKAILQANKGTNNTPYWLDVNEFVFCGLGGKPNMSFSARNIPPILSGDTPQELWVKESTVFSNISGYDPTCLVDIDCTTDFLMFRFHLIFDDLDFIYNPEFKLLERPFMYLHENTTGNTIQLNKTDNYDIVFYAFLDTGDLLQIGNELITVNNITETVDNWFIELSSDLTGTHPIKEILINKSKSLPIENSMITDTTTGTYAFSPFKLRFIDPAELDNKPVAFDYTSGHDMTNVILENSDFTTIVDLFGDAKIASLSNYSFSVSSLSLASPISTTLQTTFVLNNTSQLKIGDYITLKDSISLAIEHVKVMDIINTTDILVERGKLNSTPGVFTIVDTEIYLSHSAYASIILLPSSITKRYQLFKNIDFQVSYI